MSESEFSHDSKDESKRPLDSKFVQQTLPTIRPILNTTTIIPTLLIISLIFLPLGVGIWLYSQNIGEIIVEYTHCFSIEYPGQTCADIIDKETGKDCTCMVNLTIDDEELNKGSVYIYYYLTNHYYQNHLDYYTSKDENQLRGRLENKPAEKCKDIRKEFFKDSLNRTVLPCGALANYMFSDKIVLYDNNATDNGLYSEDSFPVPLIRTGIALRSDKKNKFENPKKFIENEANLTRIYAKPPSWKKSLWDLDRENASNNGLENEDFIVWMKVAALPNFRKLYRVVNTTDDESPYANGLPPGNYTLLIEYNYKVTDYDGTKSIILTTNSMIGAQNHFLGIAYLAVGGVCLGLTIIFTFMHFYTQCMMKTGYNFSKQD